MNNKSHCATGVFEASCLLGACWEYGLLEILLVCLASLKFCCNLVVVDNDVIWRSFLIIQRYSSCIRIYLFAASSATFKSQVAIPATAAFRSNENRWSVPILASIISIESCIRSQHASYRCYRSYFLYTEWHCKKFTKKIFTCTRACLPVILIYRYAFNSKRLDDYLMILQQWWSRTFHFYVILQFIVDVVVRKCIKDKFLI